MSTSPPSSVISVLRSSPYLSRICSRSARMTARMFASSDEQRLVAADLLAEVVVLLEDLVALQGGELAELQADDGLGLRPRSCW